jgi:predicted nucleotidyltransferase
MKTYGIICEYNPFHNGHIYQIEETRKHGATHIVAVMSGNYVQRGDVAIIDKFKRAEIAVKNGVDLVIELPVIYSIANAEMFARCGVMLLGALGCVDGISFGSESGDIDLLKNAAAASMAVSSPEKLKPFLEQGMPYPEAVQQLVGLEYGPLVSSVFDSPNNILACEYIKSMKVLGQEFETLTIKRKGVMHDDDTPSDGIASASYIRQLIEDGEDISEFVPKDTVDAIAEYEEKELLSYFDNLERPMLYKLRTALLQEIADTPDVAQGLENRIFEAGRIATSIDEFFDMVKTKRYPMARLRRILLNLMLNIKNFDLQVPPPYGRVLALNERGAEILAAAKEAPESKLKIPFGTSFKDFVDIPNNAVKRFMGLTTSSTDIYTLSSRTIRPSALDFTAKIELTKTL